MTPAKVFASQADLADKKVSSTRLSVDAKACTSEGDPNTGIVTGDDAVMVIDTQATPGMAQDVQGTAQAGDCDFRDWPVTLARFAALQPERPVPERGAALESAEDSLRAIASTRAFISDVCSLVHLGVDAGKTLATGYKETLAALRPRYAHCVIFDHCMPFDVSRAGDEATGYDHPRVWTAAERDIEMWNALGR